MKTPFLKLCAGLVPIAVAFSVQAEPMLDDSPTRVQTTLEVPYDCVGTLRPKDARTARASRWTLDCACYEREQVGWQNVREYVTPCGISRIRLQAGWARVEKDRGVFDFAWLDAVIYDAKRRGIDVWLELSYGNPIYKGGGGRNLGAGLPLSDEGPAAWDRWVEKCVSHYKGVVKDYCLWNEPDGWYMGKRPVSELVEFGIHTAEIIRRVDPSVTITAFAFGSAKPELIGPLVKTLHARGQEKLFDSIAYHHYSPNPDRGYDEVEEARALVKKYAPNLKLIEGEGGTESEWCVSGALAKFPWTELTQAKYDLRRSLGDLGHGDDTGVFHLSDLEYRTSGFHDGLCRYGILKTTGQADGFRLLKVKMAYYAVQNAVSVFNDALANAPLTSSVEGLAAPALYDWRDVKSGTPLVVFWDASGRPRRENATQKVKVTVKGKPFANPLWVDVLTGNAYRIPKSAVTVADGATTYAVLAYDSPTFVTDLSVLTLDKSAEVLWNEAQERQRAQLLKTTKSVTEARFYGPFPKDAPYLSVADLEKAGAKPHTVRAAADGRFDLKALVPSEQYVGEVGNPRNPPKLSGYLVVRVRPPRAMSCRLYERCDWFWEFIVNGQSVSGKCGGDIEDWHTGVSFALDEGWNELVFRTNPGSGGHWDAWLRLYDPHNELEIGK